MSLQEPQFFFDQNYIELNLQENREHSKQMDDKLTALAAAAAHSGEHLAGPKCSHH